MRVLIIEDEIKTGRELKAQLEMLDDSIEIVAILPSIKSVVKWFSENSAPDLIFSDIQLADGLSFEIFKQIKPSAPVIFCTAYDTYAIRAFETNSVDYLLKPIDERKLEASLWKYQQMRAVFGGQSDDGGYEHTLTKKMELMLQKLGPGSYKSTLLIHYQDKIIPLKIAEVAYFHFENSLVSAHSFSGQKYVLSHTLDELETLVDGSLFFRANRQFIINRNSIVNAEHYFTRRLVVRLAIPASGPVIVSKVKSSEFLRWLEIH
ncbi:DNA-binding LytR/AlgR family response regulator [Dyadobacter sp. BE34]|uniref:DNA-binding LytR/AlgR family response regulator n=1 Tax=Dyadobacter fermentans TaxID=94254 RepID=A0ABU1R8A2_9BACT|nr:MULTISPECIES: LytTR family DNA-binding domain-containing protein [Dyadobacter]MDR6809636.1 DNA-binding LytR/AlgR family response regulator [Dyadobacter fermentans]MDR7047314.1 DNA-binding LytR/AlgR family response regulator [Dyadobacter sp. BE242]MDR7201550.1 DNA-binding LytR/AlgR family response regulator [Dyadobacter sp. BE34]MDR7219420.1 DNA-binding LytR/AlgR family response regulator [Dyadobacter sp. BE31]MDR7267186.1 DNA-binding LytR/AlgR family response regulator [Dyadobacter sp. BE32